ncbi:peptide-methionine (S)-S-oxide reductase MsrA [Schaalia hyovaginalis]|uniref:peptide-methionine (S)-S-oxide reductase MsrA n=2 Tax=Schaalia hyovaginalis TaxID=29316 RepID=UPI0039BF2EA5
MELMNSRIFGLGSSASFLPAPPALTAPIDHEPGEGEEVLYLAAGCFWGVDKAFWNAPGVVATATGYMGGQIENPSYEQVCTSTTGHAETVRVVYSTAQTSAAQLIARFFEIHDPTQVDRQGNDLGPQYRGAIWTSTPEQLDVALRARAAYQGALEAKGFGVIATQVAPADEAGPFWYAEEYHQKYLHKNPNGYECHARTGVPCPIV